MPFLSCSVAIAISSTQLAIWVPEYGKKFNAWKSALERFKIKSWRIHITNVFFFLSLILVNSCCLFDSCWHTSFILPINEGNDSYSTCLSFKGCMTVKSFNTKFKICHVFTYCWLLCTVFLKDGDKAEYSGK